MCHFMADIYMTDGLNAYIIRQKKNQIDEDEKSN